MAKSVGLAGIAITDHDTVSGIEEAVQEGKRVGVHVIPGVEISTYDQGHDIHILGYGISRADATFLQKLSELRSLRNKRNQLLVQRLNELGIDMTEQEVNDYAAASGGENVSVGRPHFAALLVEKGIVNTIQEAFDVYLTKNGRAYVAVERIKPKQGIQWIRESGGLAVIAHPGLYGDDKYVEEIVRNGVDGIEVYHADHRPEEEEKYKRLAMTHGLYMTGGSDFHGVRDGEPFHGALGSKHAPVETVNRMQKLFS